MVKKYKLQDFHRFIDESGDMTFQHEKVIRGGSKIIVGLGASASFMIGMTYVKEDLSEARKKKINDFCKGIQNNSFDTLAYELLLKTNTASFISKISIILALQTFGLLTLETIFKA